jgi:hypothetical protein
MARGLPLGSLPQVMHPANLRFATRAGVAEWQTRMVQVHVSFGS